MNEPDFEELNEALKNVQSARDSADKALSLSQMENQKINISDVIKALDLYFNRENPPRFINVDRIPLICQDIATIRETQIEMKDDFSKQLVELKDMVMAGEKKYASKLTEKIVYGCIAIILIAFLGALIYLVLPHH